jgi:hypothetical protein
VHELGRFESSIGSDVDRKRRRDPLGACLAVVGDQRREPYSCVLSAFRSHPALDWPSVGFVHELTATHGIALGALLALPR